MKQLFSKQLKDISTYLFEGLIFLDSEGWIKYMNRVALDCFPEMTSQDLIGQPIQHFIDCRSTTLFFENKIDMHNIAVHIGTKSYLANYHLLNEFEAIIVLKNTTITQRLTSDLQTARQQIRLFQKILDQLDQGIVFLDTNHHFRLYNKKMGELDLKEPSDIIGKHVSFAYPNMDENSTLIKSLKSESQIHQNETFFSNRGKKYTITRNSFPLYLGSKKVGTLGIVTDHSKMAKFLNERYNEIKIERKEMDTENEVNHFFEKNYIITPYIEKVIADIKQALMKKGNILIHGERGVGKTKLSLHIIEQIQEERVISLQCAAMPEQILSERLFGTSSTSGLLETSQNHTLFLEDITAMSRETQMKLMRTLETKQFSHGNKVITLSDPIRIISTMTELPMHAITNGQLVKDLFFYLGTYSCALKPLRERKEDVPLLANAILVQKMKELSASAILFSKDAMQQLEVYSYPGNVRQLEMIIEASLIRHPEVASLTSEHLPNHLFIDALLPTSSNNRTDIKNGSLTDMVEEFERDIIKTTLELNDFHITKSSEQLGISRQSLNYKIRKYEIGIDRM